jgi:hypothetical protein
VTESGDTPSPYSQAFEKLVQSESDIIGLLSWLLSIAITFLIVVAGVPGGIIAFAAKLKGG